MELDQKYDRFYGVAGNKAMLVDVPVRKWPRNRAEAIVAVGGRGENILDIGCGDGNLLYQFRHRFNHLVGLEYSAERLRQAERNLCELSFVGIQGSSEAIEQLEDNSVDRIICADVIEHIADVYAATEEMFRILRPGGLLVMNTPNIAFAKKRLLLLVGRFPSTSQQNEGFGSDLLFDGGHLHYFTFRSLRLLLERAGFAMIRPMAFGRLGFVHSLWPSLTSVGVQWVATKPEDSKRS
jgi:SAM-dependent methyltransferase